METEAGPYPPDAGEVLPNMDRATAKPTGDFGFNGFTTRRYGWGVRTADRQTTLPQAMSR